MGGRDYVWHVQPSSGPAKGRQVGVDGWGMISAWYHGEESYLGQRLHGVCPKVYIVGTDQPQNDWHALFKERASCQRWGTGWPVE